MFHPFKPETPANKRAAAALAAQRAKWADRPPVNTLTRQQLRRIIRAEAKAARAETARKVRLARRQGNCEVGPVPRRRIRATKRLAAHLATTKSHRGSRKVSRAARRALASCETV